MKAMRAILFSPAILVAACGGRGTDVGSDAGSDLGDAAPTPVGRWPDATTSPDPDASPPPLAADAGDSDVADANRGGALDGTVVDASDSGGGCTPAAENMPCMGGAVTCGAWGACTYADPTCGQSGTQSRSCTTTVCKSGTCQAVPAASETQSCGARNTNGVACSGGRGCGSYGGCSCGGGGCTGSKSRSCWSYKCEQGQCVDTGADGQPTSTGCSCASGTSCSGSCANAQCDGSGSCVDCGGNACCEGACCASGDTCQYYGGGSSLICVATCSDGTTICPAPSTCSCAYIGSVFSCTCN
jgi:hypothetical protein